jgi:hypothetical protein
VADAIERAQRRKVVTVQPWVETRDGKRFLHIPPDAGYRNLFRELPPPAPPHASSHGEVARSAGGVGGHTRGS